MPIQDFHGDCFVAFTDISGFKDMMKDSQKAVKAIDKFYNAGFRILSSNHVVNGFFISDCGVLFTRREGQIKQLDNLLRVVRELNQAVMHHDIMLATSIAWGAFSYHNRIEFPGINKQPIYGNAYVSAFLDNEVGKPRLQPGQCRILKKDVEESVFESVSHHELLEDSRAHQYYYWMVERPEEIQGFKQRYQNSYNLKYAGMLKAIKGQDE